MSEILRLSNCSLAQQFAVACNDSTFGSQYALLTSNHSSNVKLEEKNDAFSSQSSPFVDALPDYDQATVSDSAIGPQLLSHRECFPNFFTQRSPRPHTRFRTPPNSRLLSRKNCSLPCTLHSHYVVA